MPILAQTEERFGAFVLEYLEKNRTTSVQYLYDVSRIYDPSITKADVTDMVWRLAEQEEINLEDVPLITRSFAEFLKLWERNLGIYTSLLVSFAALLAVYAMPATYALVILRWMFGSLFALFVPGYVTLEALFPRGRDPVSIERYALTIGLSLLEVPFVGLILNFTPWGIRVTSIVVSLTILIVGLSLIAFARQYSSA